MRVSLQAATPARPEDLLVAAARAGSESAWGELFSLYYAPLCRYASARLHPGQAEDVAAEVFEAAVAGITKYRSERPFLAWLYGIARHIVNERIRRETRREGILRRVWGRRDGLDPLDVPNARDEMDESLQRLDLLRGMRRLTESQREVLALRHFAGLTTPEIAEVMGRAPSAVYSVEARALAALRTHVAITEAPRRKPGARTDKDRKEVS